MADAADVSLPVQLHGRAFLQIAPMMDVTYKDFRFFMRLLSQQAQLWTEMVVDDTVLHNLEPVKCDRFLGYNPIERPLVCQVGGNDPAKLAEVAQIVERYGYDEINLNVGCPSCKVAQAEFGCSLMKRKELVRDIVHAMSRAVQIPVTVKCRLGVDEFDSQDFTKQFVSTVADGGCKHFIVHARKAWLSGLSPAQNRSVPPLDYTRVQDLCRSFPHLQFSLNGGVNDIGHARALLGFPGQMLSAESDDLIGLAWGSPGHNIVPPNLHGVMIGRGAMNNPMMLWDVDSAIYGRSPRRQAATRREILNAYGAYLEEAYPAGEAARSIGSVHLALKPTLGVFAGMRGSKVFRASTDTLMRAKADRELGPAHILREAMKSVEAAGVGSLDEPCQPTRAFACRPTAADRSAYGEAGTGERKRKRSGGGVVPEPSNPQEADTAEVGFPGRRETQDGERKVGGKVRPGATLAAVAASSVLMEACSTADRYDTSASANDDI
mmetsp:Transcript_131916/g.328963  ORF Transcript_131916/g.328963 Transcript_131916/m.328963 type:complete len:493 (-) Transcript_131916:386-1864(-)